jgi:hypothetical protein
LRHAGDNAKLMDEYLDEQMGGNGRWNGLVEAHKRLPEGSKKGNIAKGIARASTQNTELNLMTKEFTPKIQIISALESGEF